MLNTRRKAFECEDQIIIGFGLWLISNQKDNIIKNYCQEVYLFAITVNIFKVSGEIRIEMKVNRSRKELK